MIAAATFVAGCQAKSANITKSENNPTNPTNEMMTTSETVTLTAEERSRNMQEVYEYVRDCGVYMLATADGDQPRVRVFGSFEIIDGRIYMLTGRKKEVFKQLEKNAKFELVAMKSNHSEWIRVSGVLVDDPDLEPQKEYLRRNPHMAGSYQPGDGNMAMLYITDATARISSFAGGEERVLNF